MKPFIELYFTVLYHPVLYRVEGGRPNGVCGASFPSQVTSLDMTPYVELYRILRFRIVLCRTVSYHVAGGRLDDVMERHAQAQGHVVRHAPFHRGNPSQEQPRNVSGVVVVGEGQRREASLGPQLQGAGL